MSNEELKPCPFCGASPKICTKTLDERFGYANQVTIQCPSCRASRSAIGDISNPGYADNSTTEKRASAAWNRRAPPASANGNDAARLDFMITEECQIEHIDRIGAAPLYRVRWPWTEEFQSEWSASGRDAIDAAIEAKGAPCGS